MLGDSGAGTAGQFNVARSLNECPVDVVLHAGDIVYPYYTESLSDTRFPSVYRDQMATTPFAFAWGNHDLTGGTRALRNVMYPPPNGTPEETHTAEGTTSASYYSFDVGEVHVAVLFQPVLSQYTLRTKSAQYLWLDDDLARTTKPWKILIAHHPIATSGGHRFSDYNANGEPDWAEFAAVFQPLARKQGVQLYISGHDLVFERFLPVDGLHPFITGGGGTPLYYLLGSALGTNPRVADSDRDGLPDGWEVTHQLDPLGTEGPDGIDGDPDKDGFPNETEFQMGTSPQDPSRPTLTLKSRRQPGGRVLLQWPGQFTAGSPSRLATSSASTS